MNLTGLGDYSLIEAANHYGMSDDDDQIGFSDDFSKKQKQSSGSKYVSSRKTPNSRLNQQRSNRYSQSRNQSENISMEQEDNRQLIQELRQQIADLEAEKDDLEQKWEASSLSGISFAPTPVKTPINSEMIRLKKENALLKKQLSAQIRINATIMPKFSQMMNAAHSRINSSLSDEIQRIDALQHSIEIGTVTIAGAQRRDSDQIIARGCRHIGKAVFERFQMEPAIFSTEPAKYGKYIAQVVSAFESGVDALEEEISRLQAALQVTEEKLNSSTQIGPYYKKIMQQLQRIESSLNDQYDGL